MFIEVMPLVFLQLILNLVCLWISLQVAVRCRPLTVKEKLKSRDILRVIDDKVSQQT